ncbi:hypothetical protein EUTSA_v10028019mg [Eutrema salsugineum]|uniref:Uncharacterized protein n=1 Tax=Eutrema salsugineum TaxID=72664 RepID=V4L9U8_EUTSA|nr:hypothetical protein EUTSA_v10028019mg [Eutrema salsugineum]
MLSMPSAFFSRLHDCENLFLINLDALMARLNRVPGKSIGTEKIPTITILNDSSSILTLSGSSMLRSK